VPQAEVEFQDGQERRKHQPGDEGHIEERDEEQDGRKRKRQGRHGCQADPCIGCGVCGTCRRSGKDRMAPTLGLILTRRKRLFTPGLRISGDTTLIAVPK